MSRTITISVTLERGPVYRVLEVSDRTHRSVEDLIRGYIEVGIRRDEERLGDPRDPNPDDFPNEEAYFLGDLPRLKKRL